MHQGPQGVALAALGRHIPVLFSPGGFDPLCPFDEAELARARVNKLNPTAAAPWSAPQIAQRSLTAGCGRVPREPSGSLGANP